MREPSSATSHCGWNETRCIINKLIKQFLSLRAGELAAWWVRIQYSRFHVSFGVSNCECEWSKSVESNTHSVSSLTSTRRQRLVYSVLVCFPILISHGARARARPYQLWVCIAWAFISVCSGIVRLVDDVDQDRKSKTYIWIPKRTTVHTPSLIDREIDEYSPVNGNCRNSTRIAIDSWKCPLELEWND